VTVVKGGHRSRATAGGRAGHARGGTVALATVLVAAMALVGCKAGHPDAARGASSTPTPGASMPAVPINPSTSGSSAVPGTPAPAASGARTTPTPARSGATGSKGGSNAGSGTASKGAPSPVNPNSTAGTTGGVTFNVPISPVTTSPAGAGPQPAASPTPACTTPPVPPTVAEGITGGFMAYVDAAGTAHGPQSSFSSATTSRILAAINLSDLVTGTVITYVQLHCSTPYASQDFTLNSAVANSYMDFTFQANPTFKVGPYRLLFYINPSTNHSVAYYLDYTITP
jgi:hypothetical protein